MLEILGEEFNLFYTLVLVGLVAAAYFYLFRSPPPKSPGRDQRIVVSPPVQPKTIKKPPEVIPADTVSLLH
jgi:hypothetical protein